MRPRFSERPADRILHDACELVRRIGLTPSEQAIAAAGGLRLAAAAADLLAQHVDRTGDPVRPLALPAMLAVALSVVSSDEEFNAPTSE